LYRVFGHELCRVRALMKSMIKIGTRGSKLALWQATWVKSVLEKHHPELTVDIVVIKTKGDKILDVPLAKIGGKGLFVKEIEDALLRGDIDIAVHSMKDMPADLPEGLCIGPIPEREVPGDVLIAARGRRGLADLKPGQRIGTSSLRRAAQILHARPDLKIVPLRGNLGTRLKKLEEGQMDAIVLAAAGVKRLGLAHRITEYLDPSVMLPAVGQGALCIELRKNDGDTGQAIDHLDHGPTRTAVLGERAFLNRLEGGCQVPIAALGEVLKDQFTLTGLVADVDGGIVIKETLAGPAHECKAIGTALADSLADRGARDILNKLKDAAQE
jgi:hydroxymethylbilane synthase